MPNSVLLVPYSSPYMYARTCCRSSRTPLLHPPCPSAVLTCTHVHVADLPAPPSSPPMPTSRPGLATGRRCGLQNSKQTLFPGCRPSPIGLSFSPPHPTSPYWYEVRTPHPTSPHRKLYPRPLVSSTCCCIMFVSNRSMYALPTNASEK